MQPYRLLCNLTGYYATLQATMQPYRLLCNLTGYYATLQATMFSFKSSLNLTVEKAHEIERTTRGQHKTALWFSVRKYRITASNFGAVLSQKDATPPDKLIMQIIQPRSFSTPATRHGIENEKHTISAYLSHQLSNGHPDIVVGESGVIVNQSCFLGATPDGVVYDPIQADKPYGFIEVKCPYSSRNLSPAEACENSDFFCMYDQDSNQLKLKKAHKYFAQIQGQMAIGERPWCDLVVYTFKGISVERINFDNDFWMLKLLPKLRSFYDDCVLPEIVSPVHYLGLPIRNLSKQQSMS